MTLYRDTQVAGIQWVISVYLVGRGTIVSVDVPYSVLNALRIMLLIVVSEQATAEHRQAYRERKRCLLHYVSFPLDGVVGLIRVQ